MDAKLDDGELLRRYEGNRDESAFCELVRRHLDIVYSAALRRVGDVHAAEDIVQAVFVTLAAKAGSARGNSPLSAWLLTTVRFASANAMKVARRRERHEAAAGAGACSVNPIDVLVWQEIASELDDAVLKLSALDRRAILLRFYEQRPMRDIAHALDTTEAAAGMRVNRALVKLRDRLSRRGSGFATLGSATLVSLLESQVVGKAPTRLLASASTLTAGGTSMAFTTGTVAAMVRSKIAAIAACVAVVSLLGIGGALAVIDAGATQPTAAASTKPINPPDAAADAALDASPTPRAALLAWFKAASEGDEAAASRRAIVRSATGYCQAYARWHFASLRLRDLASKKHLERGEGDGADSLSAGFVQSGPSRLGFSRLMDQLGKLDWNGSPDGTRATLADSEWQDVGFGNLSAQRVKGGWVVVLKDQDYKLKPGELEKAKQGLIDTAGAVEKATARVDAGTFTTILEVNDFMTDEFARSQGKATTRPATTRVKPKPATTRVTSTRPARFGGTLVRVEGKALVLQPMHGPLSEGEVKVALPDEVTVKIDGDPGTFADLTPGMDISVTMPPPAAKDAKPRPAYVIAMSPGQFGTISAIDDDVLVLDAPPSSPTPLRVQTDGKTRILFLAFIVDGKMQRGGERKIADLKPGMRVKVLLANGVASKIFVASPGASSRPAPSSRP